MDLPDHLLVLVHGLNGHPSIWDYLLAKLPSVQSRVRALPIQGMAGPASTQGIRGCAETVCTEVTEAVHSLPTITKVSIVGHSLGAVVARYALALLQPLLTERGIASMSFVSVCAPHLGVHDLLGWGARLESALPVRALGMLQALAAFVPGLASYSGGRSVSELLLYDSLRTPLLQELATADRFLAPLAAFKQRVMYACTADFVVPWHTAFATSLPPPAEAAPGLYELAHHEPESPDAFGAAAYRPLRGALMAMLRGLATMQWQRYFIVPQGEPWGHTHVDPVSPEYVCPFHQDPGLAEPRHEDCLKTHDGKHPIDHLLGNMAW